MKEMDKNRIIRPRIKSYTDSQFYEHHQPSPDAEKLAKATPDASLEELEEFVGNEIPDDTAPSDEELKELLGDPKSAKRKREELH